MKKYLLDPEHDRKVEMQRSFIKGLISILIMAATFVAMGYIMVRVAEANRTEITAKK